MKYIGGGGAKPLSIGPEISRTWGRVLTVAPSPPVEVPFYNFGAYPPEELFVTCQECGVDWKRSVIEGIGSPRDSGQGLYAGAVEGIAQGFYLPYVAHIRAFTVYGYQIGTGHTGTVLAKIYNGIGILGLSIIPSGAALYTIGSGIQASVITDDAVNGERLKFYAEEDIVLPPGLYCVSVEYPYDNAGAQIGIKQTSVDGGVGNSSRYLSGAPLWTFLGFHMPFGLYGTIPNGPQGMYYFEGTDYLSAAVAIGDYVRQDDLSTITFCPGCHTRKLKHGDVAKTGTFHRDPFYQRDDRYIKADVDKGANLTEGDPDVVNVVS